jgi:hypothetical protein
MPTPADLPPAYALTAVFVTTLLPFVPYFWLDRLSVTGPRHLAHTVSHQAEQERHTPFGFAAKRKITAGRRRDDHYHMR